MTPVLWRTEIRLLVAVLSWWSTTTRSCWPSWTTHLSAASVELLSGGQWGSAPAITWSWIYRACRPQLLSSTGSSHFAGKFILFLLTSHAVKHVSCPVRGFTLSQELSCPVKGFHIQSRVFLHSQVFSYPVKGFLAQSSVYCPVKGLCQSIN